MKFPSSVKYILSAIVITSLLYGCKQKLDITAPNYIELPVVYGLLNQQDSIHYIRIEKGYLYKGDAYVAASTYDSIYYPDILKVQIKTSGGTIYNLTRVNGDAIGLPKDPGTFARDSNILYSFVGVLDPSKIDTLKITNTSNNKTVMATTSPISPFLVYAPTPGEKVKLDNSHPQTIRWATAPNAGIYDLTVRFYYQEFLQDNSLYKDTFIDIPFFKSNIIAPTVTYGTADLTEDQLIKYMANNITDHTAAYRTFNILKGMQFKFAAGGTELANFSNSSIIQQTSIASSNALPLYTNINGGAGLFSSRVFVEVDSVQLSHDGLDSLACGVDSYGLRFKGFSGQICQ